jgi:hypothetical protein
MQYLLIISRLILPSRREQQQSEDVTAECRVRGVFPLETCFFLVKKPEKSQCVLVPLAGLLVAVLCPTPPPIQSGTKGALSSRAFEGT